MAEPFDPRFTLPAVDDPAEVEIGVILLGLSADRLLAGLGTAAPGDDPAAVTLLVDRLRHGLPVAASGAPSMPDAVAAGIRRWRAARPALAGAAEDGPTAAVRAAWARAAGAVDRAGLGDLGPAARAYLAACWLRRSEVDGYAKISTLG